MPRTVEATAAGTFATIDMTAFKSRVIKTYAHAQTWHLELNEIAYSGNQVGEETVG